MKTCTKCGCENVDNVKFCKNCGYKFNQEEINNNNSQNNTCQNCGHKINEGMKFCRNCGFKISQEHENSNKTKFCTNCGTELNEESRFCPKCGISPTEQVNFNQSQIFVKSERSKLLTCLLSFFLPGLGHAYLGLRKKGLILIISYIFSYFLVIIYIGAILLVIIWIYALYDGYNSAEKMNKNIEVEDKFDW